MQVHVINRLCFDFTCVNEELASVISQKVSDYVLPEINRVIADTLNPMDDADSLRFEKIIIDLGNISLAEIDEPYVVHKFKENFKSTLRVHPAEQLHLTASPNSIVVNEPVSKQRILQHFLQHADIPWWASKEEGLDPDTLIRDLAGEQPEQLTALFAVHQPRAETTSRFMKALKPGTAHLVKQLVPSWWHEENQTFFQLNYELNLANLLLPQQQFLENLLAEPGNLLFKQKSGLIAAIDQSPVSRAILSMLYELFTGVTQTFTGQVMQWLEHLTPYQVQLCHYLITKENIAFVLNVLTENVELKRSGSDKLLPQKTADQSPREKLSPLVNDPLVYHRTALPGNVKETSISSSTRTIPLQNQVVNNSEDHHGNSIVAGANKPLAVHSNNPKQGMNQQPQGVQSNPPEYPVHMHQLNTRLEDTISPQGDGQETPALLPHETVSSSANSPSQSNSAGHNSGITNIDTNKAASAGYRKDSSGDNLSSAGHPIINNTTEGNPAYIEETGVDHKKPALPDHAADTSKKFHIKSAGGKAHSDNVEQNAGKKQAASTVADHTSPENLHHSEDATNQGPPHDKLIPGYPGTQETTHNVFSIPGNGKPANPAVPFSSATNQDIFIPEMGHASHRDEPITPGIEAVALPNNTDSYAETPIAGPELPDHNSGTIITRLINQIELNTGAQKRALLHCLNLLDENELSHLEALYRQHGRLKATERKQINAIINHSSFFKYKLLFVLATGADQVEEFPGEVATITRESLPVELMQKVQLARIETAQILNKLKSVQGVVLTDTIYKQSAETNFEKAVLRKILRQLPSQAIQLLHFLTQLPEPELQLMIRPIQPQELHSRHLAQRSDEPTGEPALDSWYETPPAKAADHFVNSPATRSRNKNTSQHKQLSEQTAPDDRQQMFSPPLPASNTTLHVAHAGTSAIEGEPSSSRLHGNPGNGMSQDQQPADPNFAARQDDVKGFLPGSSSLGPAGPYTVATGNIPGNDLQQAVAYPFIPPGDANRMTSTRANDEASLNPGTLPTHVAMERPPITPFFGTDPSRHPYRQSQNSDSIHIENAGLCLVALYLPGFFTNIGYLENKKFKSKIHAFRAVHLLQYMATGQKKTHEYLLQFNKLLCGIETGEFTLHGFRLTKKEIKEADNLVAAVIANWKAIGATTVAGFRTSFLQRKGILSLNESSWKLQVEKKGFDLLLGTLPWNMSMIKVPWMTKMIRVEW